MCIRVRYAPRHEITDPWDADRQIITIPDELSITVLYTLRAVRAVLRQLSVPQDHFGARCWCGEEIDILPAIPQQRRSEQVIHSGA
ncbi:hypothetical protein [Streptomyces chartreusis]|uniref:hypothetical protein n=1 Tax=Streptomyces chartreusis TaxID=1969 RepID=UPI003827F7A6